LARGCVKSGGLGFITQDQAILVCIGSSYFRCSPTRGDSAQKGGPGLACPEALQGALQVISETRHEHHGDHDPRQVMVRREENSPMTMRLMLKMTMAKAKAKKTLGVDERGAC